MVTEGISISRMQTVDFQAKRPDPVLVLEKITVKVGIRCVLHRFDLQVNEGEHLLVTGNNGSGKSSLLNAIAGVEPARLDSGRIFFLGRDITELSPHERCALGLSYLRQRNNIFPALTVAQNLSLALGEDGWRRFREAFPGWSRETKPEKRAGLLSGGQRQQLAFAMMALRPSRLFMADEPEAGLAEQIPWPTIRTMIVVAHTAQGAME